MTFNIRAILCCASPGNNEPDENSAPEQTVPLWQPTAEAGTGSSVLLPSSSREQARANEIMRALRGPLNKITAEELQDASDTLVPARSPAIRGTSAIPFPANPIAPPLKPVVSPRPYPIGVTLGPIDCTGKVLERQTMDSAHGFTDMAVSLRRALAELKASLAKGISGDDEGYARRSMDEWARRILNVVEGNANARAHVETVTHFLYENWRPDSEDDQTRRERQLQELQDARATFAALIELRKQSARTGVKVFEQDTRKGPTTVLMKYGEIDAYTRFAYRINPAKDRKVNASQETSRISLNFQAADAPEFVRRIGELVRNNLNIRQSKIMGPLHIGRRADDGVLYLGTQQPSLEEAKEIDKQLSAGLDGPALRTAPPGMRPISSISSYAEYPPDTHTGHGRNRGKIVAEVVNRKLEGAEGSMSSLMDEALERHGYDPQQPSLIRRR